MADLPKKPETAPIAAATSTTAPASPVKGGARAAPESPSQKPRRQSGSGGQSGGNRGGRASGSNTHHSRSPSKPKTPITVSTAGSETSIHAPSAANNTRGGNAHRKSSSVPPSTSPKNELKGLPVSSAAATSGSTLNPNAGGFQPGSLTALAEVQNEVLVTPSVPNFPFGGAEDAAYGFPSPGQYSAANTINQQYQQLQQLQMMSQAVNGANNPISQQQLSEMQQNLLAQIQLAQSTGGSMPPPPPPPASNLPPRFAAQQQQNLASNMMVEQLQIQQQLDNLRAQQDALLNRFAEMSVQQQPVAPAPGGFANVARTGHRRHQSQQVPGTTMGSMGSFGGFGQMGQFGTGATGLGFQSSQQATSAVPKGHGRRHSVNVVKTNQPGITSPNLSASVGPGSQPPIGNFSSFQFPPNAGTLQPSIQDDLDFGASPTSANQAGGFVQGHGRRDSRGSMSSLSGWGTNSGQYVQNAIPSGTTTDLAQATAQLQQLSAFRASSGHAKVPSFSMGPSQGYANQNTTPQQQRKSLFAPYLPAASIPPLVAAGKLVVGALRVNKRNRSDAYVASDMLDADIYICGSKDRNRALEGDVVAVELLEVDEVWGTKKEKEEKKRKKEENASYDPRIAQSLRKQDKKNDDVEVEGQGMTLFEDEEVSDEQRPQYAGHIVGVVHRAPGQLFTGTLGVLRPSSAATKEKQDAERRERDGVDLRASDKSQPIRIVWLRPVDKRVPLLAIPVNEAPADFVDNAEKYSNRLFCACIKRWPITSLHPFGTLVEELGPIGDIETETTAILRDCNFSTEDFNESIMKCLPPIPYTIPPREIEARRDMRDARIFTIDPETAKDLDDAVHIVKQENGSYEVGIHIADVSHFVKANTAIDREARKRATTVYLVQRAYPMLPGALSETLCSLTPDEDKLAFSVVFTLSSEGHILSTWIGKTVIRSCAKLAYSNAQAVIDGKGLPESVSITNGQTAEGISDDIKAMWGLASKLRTARMTNGALKINKIKLSFAIDNEGLPQDCSVQEGRQANQLIEEFMLLANMTVAQKIAAGLPEQALLRRHEGPLQRRLESFAARAASLGYTIDISSAGALMTSFQEIESKDDQAHLTLQLLASKAMVKAKYFCTGMLDIAKYQHYALNVPLYTHFTSPIRRYADVMVHRQLDAILLGAADTRFSMDTEAVSQVAQQCNTKKEAAKLAQEQSQHLYLCVLIANLTQQYGPVRRNAKVIGVLDEAFDVLVPDFGIEKRVHIDQMPIENHVYDDHSNTLSLYWKKGVDVVQWLAEHRGDAHLQLIRQNAERHAKSLGATNPQAKDERELFNDDDDTPVVAPKNFANYAQHSISAKKEAPKFEGVYINAHGHHIQTVKELQEVPVVITADMTISPPVIKVLAMNPFAN